MKRKVRESETSFISMEIPLVMGMKDPQKNTLSVVLHKRSINTILSIVYS